MKEISGVGIINDSSINVSGTCFQGCIKVDYFKIENALGPPLSGWDSYKSDAEWHIEFEDGDVATIYNWKDGKNYCGEEGLEVYQIKEWHIGGRNRSVSERVRLFFSDEWPVFEEIRIRALI